MERIAINPPQLFTGKAFSQTFSISGHQRLIFVSGQVDCGVDGKVRHPDDLDAQLVGTWTTSRSRWKPRAARCRTW
jgi:hypothetical protein